MTWLNFPLSTAHGAGLSWHQELNREQKQILDRFHTEIEQRFRQVKRMNTKFGFLAQVDYLRNAANDPSIDEAIIDNTVRDIS